MLLHEYSGGGRNGLALQAGEGEGREGVRGGEEGVRGGEGGGEGREGKYQVEGKRGVEERGEKEFKQSTTAKLQSRVNQSSTHATTDTTQLVFKMLHLSLSD